MSKLSDEDLAYFMANKMIEMRAVVDGMMVLRGGSIMSKSKLCELGHWALRLIESGEVS